MDICEKLHLPKSPVGLVARAMVAGGIGVTGFFGYQAGDHLTASLEAQQASQLLSVAIADNHDPEAVAVQQAAREKFGSAPTAAAVYRHESAEFIPPAVAASCGFLTALGGIGVVLYRERQ